MKNYTFWPCLFTFLIFFNQGFWSHEMKYLELDYEMKKPKPPPSMFELFSLPPLVIPPSSPNPMEEVPKERKLDPKDGNSADDSQSNQSSRLSQSVG